MEGPSKIKKTRAPDSNPFVKLEGSLNEKLAKTRAIADKLEKEQNRLRSKFNDKIEIVKIVKDDLKRKEEKLLQSVQMIGGYVGEIQSLKKDAEQMFENLNVENHEIFIDFYRIDRENKELLSRKEKVVNLLKSCKPFKDQLENFISDLPQFRTPKDLVEYYLVLKKLRKDLLDVEKQTREREKNFLEGKQKVEEKLKNLPLKILEKENALCEIAAEIDKIHFQTIEREQELNRIVAERDRIKVTSYENERWINKLYKLACNKFPDLEDHKDSSSTLKQLEKIKEFIYRATEIVKRLK